MDACSTSPRFRVFCLCAEWCATCREFQPLFERVAARHGQVDFHWVDVETHGDWADALEIETFPTLAVFQDELVLHYGPTYPKELVYVRTLETLLALDAEAARAYVDQDPQRLAWQQAADVEALRGYGRQLAAG